LGVLFRQGTALQTLEGTGVVAVDKTGTLTLGRPTLTEIVPADGCARDGVLALVAAAEVHSEHPIAVAVAEGAQAEGIEPAAASGFAAVSGQGIEATVSGRKVAAGSAGFMRSLGLDIAPFSDHADRLAGDGASPLYAAIDGRL